MKNKKWLGQHWLQDRATLDYIAENARVEGIEQVLEIGPGLGTLTAALFRVFPKVLAVEFDEELATKLPGSFPGKDLEVVHQSFLDFDLNTIKGKYVAAGNIPYYITSPIIQKLLKAENKPAKIVLLVQKEVAERAVGQDGETMLSLAVGTYSKAELGKVVPKGLFIPPPKVDSAVLILTPYDKPKASEEDLAFAKRGFILVAQNEETLEEHIRQIASFYPPPFESNTEVFVKRIIEAITDWTK